MSAPKVGEIYDLRSPGDIERGTAPRLLIVTAIGRESVECRAVDGGQYREWPRRHFTPEHRRDLRVWPEFVAMCRAILDSVSESGEPNTRTGYSLVELRDMAAGALAKAGVTP